MYASQQYYTISGEGVQEIEILSPPLEENSWNSLGKYTFKKGIAYVVLDDRIPKGKDERQPISYRLLFADAVKWVRVNEE